MEIAPCQQSLENGTLQRSAAFPIDDGSAYVARGLVVCPDILETGFVEGEVSAASAVEVGNEGLVGGADGQDEGGWKGGGGAVDFGVMRYACCGCGVGAFVDACGTEGAVVQELDGGELMVVVDVERVETVEWRCGDGSEAAY